jgi:ABC-type sugar transport system substrate-binding protein
VRRLVKVTPFRTKRRSLAFSAVAALGIVGASILLGACGGGNASSGGNTSSGGGDSSGGGGANKPAIYAIFKTVSNPYWVRAEGGANKAKASLGGQAEVTVTAGTSESDPSSQIQKVQNAVTAGADAIAIAPTDPQGLTPALTQAKNKGVKIVLIDTPMPGFDAPFVGTDNVRAGKVQAQYVNQLIGGSGKVALIAYQAGVTSTDDRLKGFLSAKDPGINVVSTLRTDCSEAGGLKAAQNMITAHPDLSAIVTVCGTGAVGAAQAIKAAKLTGKLKLVGFDGNDDELKNIQDGLETATVTQYPDRMGEVGVKEAFKLAQGESVPQNTPTGQTVVTKDNVSKFLAR